ncbi:hypothetical protein DB347_22610 [Opitutaceae bacterium EW11]|nr:hypothetical protein DB347_22610 [Opitutaceae bacterium EW11]
MKLTKIVTIGLFGLVAFLTGCASVSRQATNIYPEPKTDKGLVYFYREKKFIGCAISYNVKEGDKIVGAIANGTYFFLFADPGKHTYTASTEASSARTLDIEAGKTYYVEAGIDMGIMAGRPALKIANEAEAKSVLPNCTYATK